jgi:hypothetical protein
MNTEAAVKALTKKGRTVMEALGKGELTFFDDGLVAGSSGWGSVISDELGLGKGASGVLNGLVKQGLFDVVPDDGDAGDGYLLTDLGAAVAQSFAPEADEEPEPEPEPKPEKKARVRLDPPFRERPEIRKWIEQLRNDHRDIYQPAIYRRDADNLQKGLQALLDDVRQIAEASGVTVE